MNDDRLTAIEERLDRGSQRMDLIDESLKENTELTREIRDLIAAARLGFKVLGGLGMVFKWIGTVATAGLAMWAAIYAITHNGVPPK